MKTRTLLLLFAALMVFGLSSCKDDDEPTEITVSDASDLVVSCIENGNFGMASQLKQSSQLYEGYLSPTYCSYTDDSTILKYYGGQAIQYNYTFNWTWLVNCAGGIITSVDVNYSSTGTNETTILNSNFNATGDFTASGVESVTTEYVFNGTYSRSGHMASKVRAKNEFDYTLSLGLAQVKMDKTTYQINSGSSSVTVVCTRDGVSYNFDGTLTFDGSQGCTLILNGSSYSFQL